MKEELKEQFSSLFREGSAGLTLFFFATIGVHVYDLATRLRTGSGIQVFDPLAIIIQFLIVPALALLLIPELRSKEEIEVLYVWAGAAYGVPLLLATFQPLLELTIGTAVYSFITIFTPVWVLYVIVTKVPKQKLLDWLAIAYEGVWIVFIIFIFSGTLLASGGNGGLFGEDINLGVISSQTSIGDATVQIMKATKGGAASLMATFKQQYKETRQQLNASPNVVTTVSPADFNSVVLWGKPYAFIPQLVSDREISIANTLTTKTSTNKQTITVDLECSTSGTNTGIQLSQEPTLEVKESKKEEVHKYDCVIEKGTLLPGEHTIRFTAKYSSTSVAKLEITVGKEQNFEWTTSGSLIPRKELAAVLQEPKATYAENPLRIEIGASEKYIVLRNNAEDTKFQPELKLQKEYFEGETNAKEIIYVTPKQFRVMTVPPFIKEEIVQEKCSYLTEHYKDSSIPCTDSTEAVWKLQPVKPLNITTVTYVGIRSVTTPSEQEKLLGGGSYARKVFYALVSYDATTTASERFKVEGPEEQQGGGQPSSNLPYITSGPFITTVPGAARIQFDTNVQTMATIKYWPKGVESGSKQETLNYNTKHVADIGDLQPNTVYQALIKYTDRDNRENSYSIDTFTTQPLPRGPTS